MRPRLETARPRIKTEKSDNLLGRLTETKTLEVGQRIVKYERRASLSRSGEVDLLTLHVPTLAEIQKITELEFPGVKPNQLQIVPCGDENIGGVWVAQVDDRHVTPPYDWFEI